MIRKTTKTALLSAVVLSAAFVAQGASAAMITDWNYTVESGFTDYLGTDGTANGITGTTPTGQAGLNGQPTKLSWGDPMNGDNAQSSIAIVSPVTNSVQTNGAAAAGATFDHDNNVITSASNSLSSFHLNTQLSLTSTAPSSESGVTPSPLALTFQSHFTETPNVAGSCVAPGSPACSDIFVLTNAAEFPLSGQSFTYDGYLYTVALSISGLGGLTDAECTAAGAQSGCVGFTTLEDNDNQFTSSFTITARAVPEPGSLAMLGLGLSLIGFGFYARRRNFRA